LTDYGFVYGPAEVARLFEHNGAVCIGIYQAGDKDNSKRGVEIYVSPRGRSFRVYQRGGSKELK
jgi:hypothetical protein